MRAWPAAPTRSSFPRFRSISRSWPKRLKARERWGARFSVVVVAEGAYPRGGTLSLLEQGTLATPERLGGIGAQVCAGLQHLTGKETRAVVLGHLQRGGEPTSADRVLATRFGHKAVELARAGAFGLMVAYAPPDIVTRPLQDVVGKTKTIPLDFDLRRDGAGHRHHVRGLNTGSGLWALGSRPLAPGRSRMQRTAAASPKPSAQSRAPVSVRAAPGPSSSAARRLT